MQAEARSESLVMSHEEFISRMDELAGLSLDLWDLPAGCSVRLLNLSENATYLVEASCGFRSILRVHRKGYHSKRAIECELAWMEALGRDSDVAVAGVILSREGEAILRCGVDGLSPRYVVMFEFLEGVEPDESFALEEPFRLLGGLAAKTHLHSLDWVRPAPFERLCWDIESVLGSSAIWGDWRAAPGVDARVREVLEDCESRLRDRLASYGKGRERFGLVHADMRLANLLIDGEGHPRLIDFDDCGFGWFMYDFAAAVSFMEDDERVPALKRAWTEGYCSVRPLAEADIAAIDDFIMFRRLALLAWIGSHGETELAQSLAGNFARISADLAEVYMRQ